MSASPLAALAERALKWSAATTIARFVLQFVAQVALARLLGPGNFGVYGIGLAVLTFVGFLSGASFSYSLMLAPRLSDEDIRFSFTWQLVAGVLSAIAMFAAAPALAGFFGDPRVEPMVQVLSLASLLIAAAAPATYLLQRDLNFRVLGLVQLASYAAGYLAVGVPLALTGHGAMALGIACVVQSAVALVLTYRARPHPVRPLWRHADGGDALATGRAVFLTNVVNWLLANLDRVIIGRVLNATSVGLFTVAYNLASIPNTLLLGALQPAFLATGARLQDDRQRLAQGWLLGLASVLVLALPVAAALAVLAGDVVALLYGPAWAASGWVLAVLFLCLPAWASWGLSTPVLWNTGRRQYEFLLQLPVLAVAAPLWWWLAPGGIVGIALASACVVFARSAVIVHAALRALGLRWGAVLPDLGRGLLLALLCAGAAEAARAAAAPLGLPLVSLAAGSLAAFGAGMAVLWLRPRALGEDALLALSRLVPGLARRLAAVAPVPPREVAP